MPRRRPAQTATEPERLLWIHLADEIDNYLEHGLESTDDTPLWEHL